MKPHGGFLVPLHGKIEPGATVEMVGQIGHGVVLALEGDTLVVRWPGGYVPRSAMGGLPRRYVPPKSSVYGIERRRMRRGRPYQRGGLAVYGQIEWKAKPAKLERER